MRSSQANRQLRAEFDGSAVVQELRSGESGATDRVDVRFVLRSYCRLLPLTIPMHFARPTASAAIPRCSTRNWPPFLASRRRIVTSMTAAGCANIPGLQAGTTRPFRLNPGEQRRHLRHADAKPWQSCSTEMRRRIRLDYNWNDSNRFYVNFNYLRDTDTVWPLPHLILCSRLRQPDARPVPDRSR